MIQINKSKPIISARNGVIAAGHFMAAAAGVKMFAKGGNAVDVAVAAGIALTVLKPHQNSFGGECPILIYSPVDKKVFSISGQGVAPKKANLQWFKERGIEKIPGDGFLGATVPGLFGAHCIALSKFGKLSLAEVLQPAIEIAEEGFPLYEALRNCLIENKKRFLEEWPSSVEVFLPEREVPELGYILKQPMLGQTLRNLVDAEEQYKNKGREAAIQHAFDYFYKGDVAAKILEFAKANPIKDTTGKKHTVLLEKEDFDNYATLIEAPVSANYKNYSVFKCGPWTQGPVFLHQLKLLEGFDLKTMGHNSAQFIHIVVECSKRAFADRDRYYGDPNFSNIPIEELLSEDYNSKLRAEINIEKANNHMFWDWIKYKPCKEYSGDTTHLDAADKEGWLVSVTTSGGWIPSSPIIPSLGFPLGTRAQVFDLQEGHPNCIEPGKRPRTTLTPSIAFKDGKPWMAFGTPGGDMQDQWTLQFFLNIVEFGMNIQQAVDEPSFHTLHFVNSFTKETIIGTVFAEEGIEASVLRKLQELGHNISLLPPYGNGEVCAVTCDTNRKIVEGVASCKSEQNAYVIGW